MHQLLHFISSVPLSRTRLSEPIRKLPALHDHVYIWTGNPIPVCMPHLYTPKLNSSEALC